MAKERQDTLIVSLEARKAQAEAERRLAEKAWQRSLRRGVTMTRQKRAKRLFLKQRARHIAAQDELDEALAELEATG